MKSDNAASANFNPRWRLHSVRKLGKAARWAAKLKATLDAHGDAGSILEAEAYQTYMESAWQLEKEQWDPAMKNLKRCTELLEHLSRASGETNEGIFKETIQELKQPLRICRHHLGIAFDDDDAAAPASAASSKKGGKDKDKDKKVAEKQQQVFKTGIKYRGAELECPAENVRIALLEANELLKEKIDKEADAAKIIEKYGEMSTTFGELLKQIRGEMITCGPEDPVIQKWHLLESYARDVHFRAGVERNLVLLEQLFTKFDGLTDVTSPESRRICRVEEGLRFCEMVKEDLETHAAVPDTPEKTQEVLKSYQLVMQNNRCLFLALCNLTAEKGLEAAALVDLLQERLEGKWGASKALEAPLDPIHEFFQSLAKGLPARVARWRCWIRAAIHLQAKLAEDAKQQEQTEDGAPGEKTDQEKEGQLDDAMIGEAWPPRVKAIACKPLLFDLAFPMVVAPDVEHLLPKKKADNKPGLVRGLTSKALGGLGSKLGGLWGKK